MRIRTDERPHRRRTIEDAASAWGVNKTRAVLLSCELATSILTTLPAALEDERIPPEAARAVVEDLEGSYVASHYEGPEVRLEPRERED